MPAPIPLKRRQAAIDDFRRRKAEDPSTSIGDVARDHRVGEASLKRWLWRAEPRPPRRGNPPRLTPSLIDELVALVAATPTLRLYELATEMTGRASVRVGEQMVRRALRSRGIGKRRLVREKRNADGAVDGTRYRSRHRRKPEDRPHRRAYPSDFTNAEWEVVEPLWLEHAASVPTDHELRDVLDALRYIGATGCQWRFLPPRVSAVHHGTEVVRSLEAGWHGRARERGPPEVAST